MHPTLLQAVTLSALLNGAAYADITKCPRAENTYVAAKTEFTVCSGSNYEGTTTDLISGVPDVTACLQRCSERPTCTKAVYERYAQSCHIKANSGPMPWVANQFYDSIRRGGSTTTPPNPPSTGEGAQRDSCSTSEKSYTSLSGKKYAICAGHDFRWDDVRALEGILTVEACAAGCSANTDCKLATWEAAMYRCHLKKPASGKTIWTIAKGFDSIREV